MPRRRSFLLRWLDRLAVAFVLLLIAGVIAVCWMPAKVGPTDDSALRDGRRGSGGWRANQGQPPRNLR